MMVLWLVGSSVESVELLESTSAMWVQTKGAADQEGCTFDLRTRSLDYNIGNSLCIRNRNQ